MVRGLIFICVCGIIGGLLGLGDGMRSLILLCSSAALAGGVMMMGRIQNQPQNWTYTDQWFTTNNVYSKLSQAKVKRQRPRPNQETEPKVSRQIGIPNPGKTEKTSKNR